MCLADRLKVFLIETERPDKSRKIDLVKKFGQKEVLKIVSVMQEPFLVNRSIMEPKKNILFLVPVMEKVIGM